MAMKTRYNVLNGQVLSETRSGVRRDYLTDGLGNTLALLDATQTKTDTFDYFPSGTVAARTGTNPTPFQWNGGSGYFTDSSSRKYVRARNYFNNLGRWGSQDPIGFDGGDFNLYRYCGNRFVVMTDPSGLLCRPTNAFVKFATQECWGTFDKRTPDRHEALFKNVKCTNVVSYTPHFICDNPKSGETPTTNNNNWNIYQRVCLHNSNYDDDYDGDARLGKWRWDNSAGETDTPYCYKYGCAKTKKSTPDTMAEGNNRTQWFMRSFDAPGTNQSLLNNVEAWPNIKTADVAPDPEVKYPWDHGEHVYSTHRLYHTFTSKMTAGYDTAPNKHKSIKLDKKWEVIRAVTINFMSSQNTATYKGVFIVREGWSLSTPYRGGACSDDSIK